MVIKMTINLIIEPEYKDTTWCRETLSGIKKQVSALRYEQKSYAEDTLSEDIKKIIIIGTSPVWVSKILFKVKNLGIYPVIVSCHPIEKGENASYVLIDHSAATRACINYLHAHNHNSIALYGINSNSYADNIKAEYFNASDIFFITNNNSLSQCFKDFFAKIEKYNAVICSNYITAVQLTDSLKKEHVQIPRDMYIMTYGDSLLGRRFRPSVTTVTLNHELLGVQAVNLFRFLEKDGNRTSVTIYIPCEIVPAMSTEHKPAVKLSQNTAPKNDDRNLFYTDKDIVNLQSLEKLLRKCDKTDAEIIDRLHKKIFYSKIAEDLFISEGSVKYRIKKLLLCSGIDSVEDILSLCTRYLEN